jgi:hypothetical protein
VVFSGSDEIADGRPEPPVPGRGGQAGQVERDRDGDPDNVAVRSDNSDGEVSYVKINGRDRGLSQFA